MDNNADIYVLPDNDSFLPRYLTVQLLAIMAKAFPYKRRDSLNNQFVDTFRNKNLFTPITYSIFWREPIEDIENTVSRNLEIIDELDSYNRAPLLVAIANEDFELANMLIEKGGILYLEDKLMLEITLMTMLQRDENIAVQILSNTKEEDIGWVGDHLDYLHGFAVGNPVKKQSVDRDVIDPPLRHFGQTLDTIVYFNGAPSYFGFLSPSLNALCEHLNSADNDELLQKISRAFTESSRICDFHGNLPRNTDAANALVDKINGTIRDKEADPVVLLGGWAGDAIGIAIYNNTLVLSNLGTAGDLENGTHIYSIKNADALNVNFVKQFINGLGNAADPSVILASIGEIVDTTPTYKMKQPFNPIDNCIYVNPRIIIEGIMLVLSAYKKHGTISAESLSAISGEVSTNYNNFIDSMYQKSTASLVKFMRNGNLLRNRRIECCALALEYINQHYTKPEAIQRCIELKDALEFVGLQEYYANYISDDAKKAIQAQMIRQQEVDAVEVIQAEHAMLSALNSEDKERQTQANGEG